MSDAALEQEIIRLKRRVERANRARMEAETIAERVTRQLYERQKELELLRTIAETANSAKTINEAVQNTLDQICAYTGWPIGHTYFVENGEPVYLRPSDIWYLAQPEKSEAFRTATKGMSFVSGEGLPGRVYAQGEPIWISDVTKDSNFPRAAYARVAGVCAGFAFPILVNKEVVAVFEFFATEPLAPNAQLLSLMADVGKQLGILVARKRVKAALLQAKEAAEAANLAKTDFLAMVSHELRTPMNGIIGLTELVLDTELNAEQQEYLTMVQTCAADLLQIINSLLDFSQLETNQIRLHLSRFNLRQTCANLLQPLRTQALDKGLTLTYEFQADVPEIIYGDIARIQQVLMNLIGNAIKFTAKGSIHLTVRLLEQNPQAVTLQFQLCDTGVGIAAEKQRLIFEAFTQADNSATRNFGGTGLGLAIAARLVELMHGRLWVESQEGKGSCFYFTVQCAAEPMESHRVSSST